MSFNDEQKGIEMQESRTLGDCEFGEVVTLITGPRVELIRENFEFPGWLIVKNLADGSTFEYHRSCRLKGRES